MQETWAIAPNFPHYEASNLGRIRRISTGRILNQRVHQGYARVSILVEDSGIYKEIGVHRLVCAAFHGPAPEGKPWVNHKDGHKSQNSPDNLEWSSPSENARHSFDVLGNKVAMGSKHTCAKLCETDIPVIRNLRKNGMTLTGIGRIYGVDRVTIRQIFTGRSWAHVS